MHSTIESKKLYSFLSADLTSKPIRLTDDADQISNFSSIKYRTYKFQRH